MFSDTEIAELRQTLDAALMDTCIPQTRAATDGAYGAETGQPTYTDGEEPINCLYLPNVVEETIEGQVQQIDGTIHLCRETVINNFARIKLTHQHGDKLTPPLVFEIVGGPNVDHTGVRLKVRKVTDGS